MNKTTHVAIVGAGPYGLSLAAHLRAAGVPFRIFGSAMHNWRHQMPQGMYLKSEAFASSLYDPGAEFTLEVYCREKGIPYARQGLPVSLADFIAYGLEFQRRFVPTLEDRQVVAIKSLSPGFLITCNDGETCSADRVVIASGISYYHDTPQYLRSLPEEFVTHSAKHSVLDRFKGKDVTVLGGGSSAVDTAASLLDAGAKVTLVARAPKVRFLNPPVEGRQSWLKGLRTPSSGLGPGWRSRLCCDAPLLFRLMPQDFRFRTVRTHLGPTATSFVKKKVEGRLPMLVGTQVTSAEVKGNKIVLHLVRSDGTLQELVSDHVIAATGYKVDLRRLPFLDETMLASIRSVDHTPVLSSQFESSIPGLYFVGLASANTFGPLLRFAFGAGFASRHLSKHLRGKSRAANPLPVTG